jgi:hypothetical protein
MVYPALLPLMHTPRLPVVDWTEVPADLNRLVRFSERRNLVSARVPSHFKRSLRPGYRQRFCWFVRIPWRVLWLSWSSNKWNLHIPRSLGNTERSKLWLHFEPQSVFFRYLPENWGTTLNYTESANYMQFYLVLNLGLLTLRKEHELVELIVNTILRHKSSYTLYWLRLSL